VLRGPQGARRANLPLSDTATASVSVNRAKRDGFTTNVYDGSTVGNRDVTSWRAQLHWDAAPQFSVRASVDGLRAREAGEYGNAFTDTLGSAPSPRQTGTNTAGSERRGLHLAPDSPYRRRAEAL